MEVEVYRIYRESRSEGKENTWDLMRLLKEQNNLPWVCSGDFNEILFNYEKEGHQEQSLIWRDSDRC